MTAQFTIPVGYKFSCIGLNTNLHRDIAGENLQALELGGGLWAVFELPFKIDDIWTKWLGSIQSERFSENNLFLLAIAPSDAPDILDGENQWLSNCVQKYYYSLLLHGVAYSQQAPLLSGANTNTPDVRQVSSLNTSYRPGYVKHQSISVNTLTSAAQVYTGIETIFRQDSKYMRIRRGLHAWRRAVEEADAHYRLHQFVRAIEAVIKPGRRVKKLTEQFIYRTQFFTGHSPASAELVSAFYELRSAAEHMYDLEPVLTTKLQSLCSKYPTYSPAKIITLLSYQAEALVRFIYTDILKDTNLQSTFIDDDSITHLWDQTDAIIKGTLRETIDLDAAVKDNFIDYI